MLVFLPSWTKWAQAATHLWQKTQERYRCRSQCCITHPNFSPARMSTPPQDRLRSQCRVIHCQSARPFGNPLYATPELSSGHRQWASQPSQRRDVSPPHQRAANLPNRKTVCQSRLHPFPLLPKTSHTSPAPRGCQCAHQHASHRRKACCHLQTAIVAGLALGENSLRTMWPRSLWKWTMTGHLPPNLIVCCLRRVSEPGWRWSMPRPKCLLPFCHHPPLLSRPLEPIRSQKRLKIAAVRSESDRVVVAVQRNWKRSSASLLLNTRLRKPARCQRLWPVCVTRARNNVSICDYLRTFLI